MELMDALRTRRSVREYTGEKASADELATVLSAGQAAPVGFGAYGSIRITVVEDPALLADIEACCAGFMGKPDAKPLYGAPALVVVSASEMPDMGGVEWCNAAIVAHNMTLAATDLGLGSCFIWGAMVSMAADAGLVARLGLPEGFRPYAGLTLGRTATGWGTRDIPADRIAVNRL